MHKNMLGLARKTVAGEAVGSLKPTATNTSSDEGNAELKARLRQQTAVAQFRSVGASKYKPVDIAQTSSVSGLPNFRSGVYSGLGILGRWKNNVLARRDGLAGRVSK